MADLLAARAQMAMSLGFHIIFAVIGIAMPLLMVIAEGLWLKTREEVYLTLANRKINTETDWPTRSKSVSFRLVFLVVGTILGKQRF